MTSLIKPLSSQNTAQSIDQELSVQLATSNIEVSYRLLMIMVK